MVQLILAIVGSSAFSVSLGFMLGRGKAKAETEKIKLENIDKLIDIYKEVTEDLKTEVKALRSEVGELRKENKNLKSEITKLEKTLAEFQHN